MAGGTFVDHYFAIGSGACPETPQEELKRIYFEKLRQFHPDKRPGSAGDLGAKVTQALTEAWDVLRDPELREAYDTAWRREQEARLTPPQKADLFRRRGNELYAKARDMTRTGGGLASLGAVQESLRLYQAAMENYTKAAQFTPCDHRLFSNRALCYSAVEDWARARDDAQQCTKLKPDFMKGWFLLVKALWRMGRSVEAQLELQNGLTALPGCRELVELQQDLSRGAADAHGSGGLNHSVSPARTQGANSRGPTPPPQQSRPVSPPLMAAGAQVAGDRARTYAGPSSSSRSPGAAGRVPPGGAVPRIPGLNCDLDASTTCVTGNFGAPTPNFANGAPPPLGGNARSSYSPGPSGYARTYGPTSTSQSPGPSSRSPGASARSGPGPDFSPGGKKSHSPITRKSASLRQMAVTSRNTSPHQSQSPCRR